MISLEKEKRKRKKEKEKLEAIGREQSLWLKMIDFNAGLTLF